jgi:hypothetical protein
MQLVRFAMHEQRHRRAPVTLPGHAPVGTVVDHAFQARASPGGEEFSVRHGALCNLAQQRPAAGVMIRVHADEPLRVARKMTGVLCRQQCG